MPERFNYSLLLLARQYRERSQSEVARAAGLNQGHYSRIENGLLPEGPSPDNAKILFTSAHANGVRDPGETTGIGGVTITLRDGNGNTVATAFTLGNGSYSFPNLVPGNYTIVATQPAGFGSSTPNTLNVTVPASVASRRRRLSSTDNQQRSRWLGSSTRFSRRGSSVHLSKACGQRGRNLQPFGALISDGGVPLIECRRSCFGRSSRGIEPSSPHVYGCCGA